MNLLPRSVATLTLAVSAVPGVAPLAAHPHPQQHRPMAQHAAVHHVVGHPAVAHVAAHPLPHALIRPAIRPLVHPMVRPVLEAKLPGAVRLTIHAVAHPVAKVAADKTAAPTPERPGGWTPQNPASPAVLGAATFAVQSLSQTLGKHYVVENIDRADSQVVEGVDYRLKLRIAQLDGEILGARKDCTVGVWSRPWLKPADKLVSADCQSVDAALPAAPVAPAIQKAMPAGAKQVAAKKCTVAKKDVVAAKKSAVRAA